MVVGNGGSNVSGTGRLIYLTEFCVLDELLIIVSFRVSLAKYTFISV